MARPGVALVVLAALAAPAAADEVRAGWPVTLAARPPRTLRVPAGVSPVGAVGDEIEALVNACVGEIGDDFVCRSLLVASVREAPFAPYLPEFRIDRLEVTVREYRACVHAGGCNGLALFAGDPRLLADDRPMVNVTHAEAAAYCAAAGGRLPDQLEWEKAARGPTGRRWPWGDTDALWRANRGRRPPAELLGVNSQSLYVHQVHPDPRDGAELLAPPGSYPLGASPYGVLDLVGNAAEWTGESALDANAASPRAPVAHGGSFLTPAVFSRPYVRLSYRDDARLIFVGFRCAYDAGRGRQ